MICKNLVIRSIYELHDYLKENELKKLAKGANSILVQIYTANVDADWIPTGATSNQMYERVSTLLGHHGLGKANLLHSTAWLVDKFTKNESVEDSLNGFSMPLRRGLLSQFAVGTVDQIMMSVMHIRFSILRLLGAASKVIIIDEVHAYDRYMFTIITRFLEWCKALKIPVVLLSATLPSKRKQEILKIYQKDVSIQEEYPLITTGFLGRVCQKAVSGTGMKQKIYLKRMPILDDIEAIAKQVLDKAEFGGAICAIMNSVNESIDLYNAVKKLAKMDVLLFHGRFNVKRRAEIEEECLLEAGLLVFVESISYADFTQKEFKDLISKGIKCVQYCTSI